MFLRIATRQIEQINVFERRHLCLWIEEAHRRKSVYGFLIEKTKALGIARQEHFLFPYWE